MAFTQKLFSSYHNYPDGNTRVGELNRIWYDSNTNTLRIQLDATPGGTIISGGGGLVLQALSVNTVAASSGGTLTYSNGTFTYAPADLSSLASTTYVNNQIDAVKDRIASPNDLHVTRIDNTGTTTSGGDIIPGASTYNLGSAALPWNDVYVSKGSIVIADLDPAIDGVSISNTSKYIVIDRGGLKVTANDGTHEIFQLDNTGKLLIKSEIPSITDNSAFEVIGSLLGTSLPIINKGVMIHSSGAVNIPSRIYIDGVGTQTTAPYDSAYAAFIGRYARNTVADPQPAQAGDLIVRFGGNAYASGIGLNSTSNVRVDMVATETQSSSGRGSRIEFWTTDIGSATPTLSAHIDSQGIDLSEAADVTAGITFKNGSILRYWPAVTGNNNKILRTDGTDFFWSSETVPSGQVLFKGNWDASGNSPVLSTSLPTGVATGWQYIVSVAGTQNINGTGNVTYGTGDQLIYNGSIWVRIPAAQAQVQANWTETNSSLPAYIQNKPTFATVATTGSYSDLLNKPTIPAAQIPSDWNATSGLSKIENKPTIPTQYTDTLARAAITLTSNTPSGTTSTLNYVDGVFTFTSAAALVSGTTIKTVNSNSLLGSGNVTVGTVTSVSGTGTVSGLTLSGTVSVSGSLTLGGTLSGITNTNLSGTAGITNANLANSSVTVTAGTGLTGGGSVSLGGTAITLTNAGVLSVTTNTGLSTNVSATGNVTITNTGVTSLTTSSGLSTNTSATGAVSITNTGVTALTTSSGLSTNTSATGAVSITNTGVTSIVAGSNITISGSTGAVTINSTSAGIGGNQLVYELNASLSLASVKNTLVSMFGLTSGVALASNTRYQYEIVFTLSSNKAGAISYALALSGGAVIAQHNFQWMANKTTTIDGYAAGIAMASFNATGAAITTAKDIAAFDNFTHVVIYGNIDVTTAGNVNFMLSQDQNTPITWAMLPGAFIKLLPLGAIGANTVAGTWA